jgi:hypothetical protein
MYRYVYNSPHYTVLQQRQDNIFRIENPSVWQILMFSQIFPMRNMGRLLYVRNFYNKKNSLLLSKYSLDMANNVF